MQVADYVARMGGGKGEQREVACHLDELRIIAETLAQLFRRMDAAENLETAASVWDELYSGLYHHLVWSHLGPSLMFLERYAFKGPHQGET